MTMPAVMKHVGVLERCGLVRTEKRGRTLSLVWATAMTLTLFFYFTGSQPVWPLIGPLLLVAVTISFGLFASRPVPLVSWLRSRSLPVWIFVWFLLAATALTIIGIFFRGPGWSYTLPWRDGVY